MPVPGLPRCGWELCLPSPTQCGAAACRATYPEASPPMLARHEHGILPRCAPNHSALFSPGGIVSAILLAPNKIVAGYVLPHGAVQECTLVPHATADAGPQTFLAGVTLQLYLRQFRRKSSASLG